MKQLLHAATALLAISGAAHAGDPDLVARHIYANHCDDSCMFATCCVFAPGTAISIVAFVTNESFTPTDQPFGARVIINRDGETPREAETAAEPGRALYRYHWDNLAEQSAAIFSWDHDWIPQENGTYHLVLQVDDFKAIDANDANDTTELTVVITDAKQLMSVGVAGGHGGFVTYRGAAGEAGRCEDASCAAKVVSGSTVDLEAVSQAGFRLVGWEGERAIDCIFTNNEQERCEVVVNSPKTIVARFAPVTPEDPPSAASEVEK